MYLIQNLSEMRNTPVYLLLFLIASLTHAQSGETDLLRTPALSPDGQHVAFS